VGPLASISTNVVPPPCVGGTRRGQIRIYSDWMPASDHIHVAVRNALTKDGWTITDDPFTISYEEITVFADLAAEKTLAAEREGRRIVVEVKSFIGRSPIRDFEQALGQYALYMGLLEATEPDRELFIAVSDETYADLFQQKAIQFLVSRFRVAIVVVNVETEQVTQWIK
jgi:hypothetical protein